MIANYLNNSTKVHMIFASTGPYAQSVPILRGLGSTYGMEFKPGKGTASDILINPFFKRDYPDHPFVNELGSSLVNLGAELSHSYRYDRGEASIGSDPSVPGSPNERNQIDERRVHGVDENLIRAQLHEAPRTTRGGYPLNPNFDPKKGPVRTP